MRLICFCFSSFFVFLLVTSAHADLVAVFDFAASGFSGGPESEISGSFTTTYTPIVGNGTNVSTLDAIDLSIDGNNYTLANTELIVRNARSFGNQPNGNYVLGGLANGGANQGGNFSNDFRLEFTISSFGGNVSFSDFNYTRLGDGNFYNASNVSITASAVPEPSCVVFTRCRSRSFTRGKRYATILSHESRARALKGPGRER